MSELHELVPDADVLLELEPEELAGVVMEHLHSVSRDRGLLNRHNYTLQHTVQGFPREKHGALRRALMEAWVWLEREGLLAPDPEQSGEWVFITRRGMQVRSRKDIEAYRKALLLPRELLHGGLASKVTAAFLRGDYDAAVFQSFKEVEVAVRDAGNFAAEDIGVDLMRKAFRAKGPLSDESATAAERDALSHLFAGAVGSYKNPHSHRNVEIQPREAVEMIVLASHLLWIVEGRAPP